ncbi:tRNA lysidine(34) synthetase TilS [Heliophilum fasciatum]|uniref:tRNA(Ile)-lysidine synthase n=1 Tax=Heliophilum fasciatum TaxID=35700 RepID=A0A4R2RY24_9FIRM|nr:tRNA lysidine(34) synthetase TilS [Heliophilum fasciatum]MCW2277060.1 tRNA(Ile)-lysidine synthase [Heliophilum fasciatum]TCP68414.1 tRNA(Ile)-lysidine synthase [Heliophilum fasciatum]
MKELLQRFHDAIVNHQLLLPGERVLLAVSGGVDSVCLFLLFHQLAQQRMPVAFGIAHFHHGLRGASADEDAAFVAKLAADAGVPCWVEQADEGWWHREQGTKMEAARRLRYAFLERVADEGAFDRIALGHHADDQAETVVFHLLRGTGLRGLTGMPVRRGRLIRPLLGFRRQEIETFVRENGGTWREDESNVSDDYTRNHLRHHLLPMMSQYNPNLVATLQRMADVLREEDRCMQELAEETQRSLLQGDSLDCAGLLALPVALQRRVLRSFLERQAAQVDLPYVDYVLTTDLLQRLQRQCGQAGAVGSVGRGALVLSRGKLTVASIWPPRANDFAYPVPLPLGDEPMRLEVPEAGGALIVERLPAAHWQLQAQPQERFVFFLAPEAVRDGTLLLRSRRSGDRIALGSGSGRKKIKDLLIDAKVPRQARDQIPVLLFDDEVIWVIGQRKDGRYRPTANSTSVLCLRWQGGESMAKIFDSE